MMQYSIQQEKGIGSNAEKDFGKPLDQYNQYYREVKHLGIGAMGSVILVERRTDSQ